MRPFLLLFLPLAAQAAPVTDTFGSTNNSGNGPRTVKANSYRPNNRVQLQNFDVYLNIDQGEQIEFIVWEKGNDFNVIWTSGMVSPATGEGWKGSGAVNNVFLEAGRQYAIGFFTSDHDVAYFYHNDASALPRTVSWGENDGALFYQNWSLWSYPNPPPWPGFSYSDAVAYRQRLTVDVLPPPPDNDGDGFNVVDDCDDSDDTIYPGASEDPCILVDQNCDGNVPDGSSCPDTDTDTDADADSDADADADSDADADADGDADKVKGADEFADEELKIGSCDGCASGAGPVSPWWLALPVFFARRRSLR